MYLWRGLKVINNLKKEFYKNCHFCGKIVTKDRWIDKIKAEKNNARPLCKKCSQDADDGYGL